MITFFYTTMKKAATPYILWLGLLFISTNATAQFQCLSLAYLFQGSETGVYAVDLASGEYADQVGVLVPGNKLNAVGFDPRSRYIWAFNMTTGQLVEYDGNWSDETFYTVSGLPGGFYVGDIDDNSVYHLYQGNRIYTVDLSSGTPTLTGNFSASAGSIHDIAFNPVDDNIYTVQQNTDKILRINSSTGNVTDLGTPSIMAPNGGAYGAVFFDGSGDMYASHNSTGHIYRISAVHSLSSGGSPTAVLFAFGPSSGNNDGTKCPQSEVSEEGCANGGDDDFDDLVDCEDPLCASNVACRSGGGGGGGLETHGGLAEKIALRSFRNARYNVDLEDPTYLPQVYKSENYKTPSNGFFRNDYNITEFMPIDVIPGSYTLESTPTDLVGLSNALEVASIDSYINDLRVGSVLAIKSNDGVYEHSKYVCDRVKGAVIRSIETYPLDGEHDFSVTWFKNQFGGQEYGTLFSVYLNENNEFVLESHWSTYAYSEQEKYYNFQVWANSIPKLEYMTQEILGLLEVKAPIVEYIMTDAPEVFINDHRYENETLTLIVTNKTGARSLSFQGVQVESETGNRDNIELEIPLNGNPLDTVELSRKFFTLSGTLTHDEEQPYDQIYVGNGSWGLNYDKEENSISDYKVTPSTYPADGSNGSFVERNVEVKGTLGSEVTVFRTLRNAAFPKNVSLNNTLTFELEGKGEIEIVLIKESIKQWADQPRITVQLEGQCKQTYLKKTDFAQKDGDIEWNDLKSISFIKKATSNTEEPFELAIRNVAFLNLAETPSCADFNTQDVTAYPNPFKEELNLVLSAGGYQSFDLYLINQLGQQVSHGSGITDGQGRIKFIPSSNLAPGMYSYRVDLESGSYSGKVVVAF